MSSKPIPKLTLVGAGPGDPDLITVKGIKALSEADVVLYDALASEELLSYASTHSTKIFVGKRAGVHHLQQREINKLIVRYAYSHGHVVRLKGGDPFVFGRGLEELEYAKSHDLQTEVIPGISSSMSVPAMQGIPLTHRGISESFWVVTGTTRDDEFSADLSLAARSSATVVVLMGMKKIEKIMEVFKTHKKEHTHVAIIQNGTRPDERLGLGTVATISDVVKEHQLGAPAIIIIGDIVRHVQQENVSKLVSKYIAK